MNMDSIIHGYLQRIEYSTLHNANTTQYCRTTLFAAATFATATLTRSAAATAIALALSATFTTWKRNYYWKI